MTLQLRVGSATDPGRVRSNNQDALLEAAPVYAVADGMGGHSGGEVASAVAVEAMRDFADEGLTRAMKLANRAVWARADDEPGLRGMGTTMTAVTLLAGGQQLLVANVGDSRTYLLRGGELTQVTVDHSLVEELVREGRLTEEEARTHPQRNIVTRVLGNEPDVEVDEFPIDAVEGDRLLLCSDGLFGEVDDDRIAAVLRRTDDPTAAAAELVRLANEGGGRDNITVLVVDVVDAVGDGDGDGDGDGRAQAASAALAGTAGTVESRPSPPAPPDLDPDADPEPDPDPEPGARGRRARRRAAGERPPRRLTWRSALFTLAVLAVLGGAGATVWWFATSTYYVGLSGDQVAVFRGRPGGVLWIDPVLEQRTGLTLGDLPAARREDVEAGHEEASLAGAERYLEQLQDEADRNREAATPPTTTTSTAPSTTTTAPAPPSPTPTPAP